MTPARLARLPGVFAPRSDSWLLSRLLREYVAPGETALDPFTGSGILAISAAAAGARTTAVDVARRAIATVKMNALLNGADIEAKCGDMFEPVGDRRFDLVVANPPYVPAVDDESPRGAARAWDAGPDGREILDRFLSEVADHLNPRGRVLVVHSSVNNPKRTEELLSAGGLDVSLSHRVRGPFGELLSERAEVLEARGLIEPGQRWEEILVFCGKAAAERELRPQYARAG